MSNVVTSAVSEEISQTLVYNSAGIAQWRYSLAVVVILVFYDKQI